MYGLERGKFERAMSGAIVIAGLTTAAAGAEFARSTYERSSESGTQAEGAHNITSTLDSAEYDLTYHPAYTTVIGGKVPVSIYHPPVNSDTSLGRIRIQLAVKQLEAFPLDTQQSRVILRQAQSNLPENIVGTTTYSNAILEISQAKQSFVEKMNPDLRNTYFRYQDMVNRQFWSAVAGIVSATTFLSLTVGAAAAGELSEVKGDLQYFLNASKRILRRGKDK